MDKEFQDIHYIDSNDRNTEFVLRCVHIIHINMGDDFTEIYFRDHVDKEAKLLLLPKIRGSKLIID